ncbi:DUF2268 domain-containing putative Zn-dependent protease [Chitinophaga varians]|uniref:DUF2268 domain-containing putative Zn-dependent protease n=1 Tax=Chitinophaga varians TaxID=2202339 RepID=UPI001660030D|nr:DUF2268 domain-containing putative Zn-dependent protease [Chitinophaga varians]MBC9913843.1 hypothetical protein [Chitinophaga varians]
MHFIRNTVLLLLTSFVTTTLSAQTNIYDADIDLFWKTFDSVHTVKDAGQQLQLIQTMYLDKGTKGLKELARIRNWTPEKFQKSFAAHPEFWASIRPNTLKVKARKPDIEKLIAAYKRLYPSFKTPAIYFTIGYMGTGGTTTQTEVLIGTEIGSSDSTTNAVGLNPFLQGYFKDNQGILQIVAHELSHTQHKGGDMEDKARTNLLGFCIAEGLCDFMAELLLQHPLKTPYMRYGKEHEKEIWQKFKQEMHGTNLKDWLYNGVDLGYFVGYAICKSYYEHATDKAKAIDYMIKLDNEQLAGLDKFLAASGYMQ